MDNEFKSPAPIDMTEKNKQKSIPMGGGNVKMMFNLNRRMTLPH